MSPAREDARLRLFRTAPGGLIERHGMRAPYALAIAVLGAGTLAAAVSPALRGAEAPSGLSAGEMR